MNRIKRFIVLALLILLFSYSINAEEKNGAITEPVKNSEIKVLEERINSNKEITTVQLNALDEKINSQQEMLTDKIASKSESLEERMNIYLGFVMGLLAIIGFVGFKTISRWIMQTIVSKTDEEVKNYVTDEYIKDLLKEKGESAVNALLSELDTEAKKRLSVLDDRLARLESLQSEYITSLADLERKTIDLNKPMTKETIEEIEQFGEKVAQVKTEDKFTFDDWFYKAVSEYHHGNYDTTIAYFTKSLEKYSNNPHTYSNRGLCYDKLEQYDKAIEDYSKAIELDPNDALFYSNRGLVYSKLEQYDKATEDCNKAIELDPNGTNAYNNRGLVYGKLEQYDKAIEDYSKAIKLDPSDALFYSNRGIVYVKLEQYDKAMEDYSKAIELNPNYTNAYSNRGLCYDKLEQYDKAIEDYNKAIEIDPSNPLAYDNRGVHFTKLEQYDKAMEDYSKAIELDPNYTNAIMNFSELEIMTGNYDSALNSIKKGQLLPLKAEMKAAALYLECVAKKLLNMDTTASEKEFNEILINDFTCEWSFGEIESWLEDADIDEGKKKFIKNKTEQLKKHKR